jgi:hypothetical protein
MIHHSSVNIAQSYRPFFRATPASYHRTTGPESSATTSSAQVRDQQRHNNLTRTPSLRAGCSFSQTFGVRYTSDKAPLASPPPDEGQGATDTGAGSGDGSYLIFERLHALAPWPVSQPGSERPAPNMSCHKNNRPLDQRQVRYGGRAS